jgi:glycosyltransferase involved in cell wall biosynthesis
MFLVTEDWYFVSHRLPLAVGAIAAGFEVAVVTRVREKAEAIRATGSRVIPFEMRRRGMNPVEDMMAALRLARLLQRERPDVLHLVALKPMIIGGLAARLAGVRHPVFALTGMGFLFTEQGRGGLAARLVKRLLVGLTTRGTTIVQNPDDASLLADLGVDPRSLREIRGAGVDTGQFEVRPLPSGTPVVMLPARILWDKGVGEFVAAARLLRSAGVEARFVLVGAPDFDNPAAVPEAELAGWRSEGVVELWGQRDDMPEVLAQARVVCLPSYREGLPKVLLEAMACGRPVVTTDAPGCREVVRDGVNGLLVPVKSDAELAAALRRLIEDRELCEGMGREGRRRAAREFSQEIIVRQTLDAYREVLAQ